MGRGRSFKMLSGDEDLIPYLQPTFQEIIRAPGTYAEIAEDMGVAVGTVRSKLNRARTALKLLRRMAKRGELPS